MSVIALMIAVTGLVWLGLYAYDRRIGLRLPMRVGMGVMLLLAGTDHFLNGQLRYVPMMPELLRARLWRSSGSPERPRSPEGWR